MQTSLVYNVTGGLVALISVDKKSIKSASVFIYLATYLLCFCLSIAYIVHNPRTQRSSVPKFGRKVPHLRCDSHTSFKVKVTRPINADTHRAPYLPNAKAYELQTWYTDGGRRPASAMTSSRSKVMVISSHLYVSSLPLLNSGSKMVKSGWGHLWCHTQGTYRAYCTAPEARSLHCAHQPRRTTLVDHTQSKRNAADQVFNKNLAYTPQSDVQSINAIKWQYVHLNKLLQAIRTTRQFYNTFYNNEAY